MKKYLINWNRNDYGYITIEAENEAEAREKFESGEWEEKDLFIKNGGMDIDSIGIPDSEYERCYCEKENLHLSKTKKHTALDTHARMVILEGRYQMGSGYHINQIMVE